MKLFCDLETTGLDETEGCPLEVGVIVTTDDFEPVWNGEFLVGFPPEELEELIEELPQRVRSMHEDSGLIDALRGAAAERTGVPYEEFEDGVKALFDQAADYCALSRTPIAGFNPFFDRRWLDEWAPSQMKRLHYRSFDCSTLRALVDQNFPGQIVLPPGVAHRALADCESAAGYAKEFLALMRGGC